MRRTPIFWAGAVVVAAAAGLASSQASPAEGPVGDGLAALEALFPVPSMSGNEERLAAKIRRLLPSRAAFDRDNLGGLYLKLGQGEPGLAVMAAMDEFGYVVSGITAEGYLTVDRPTPPPLQISDSFLLGHPVVLSTRKGIQPGIVVQPAMHVLTKERREQLASGPALEMIFIDVGARSEAEARAKGVEILDSITPWPDLVTLANGRLAGPALGQKAACAALAAAASGLLGTESAAGATFVWMAQTRLSARGERASLGAVRARNKISPKAVLLLDIVSADRGERSPVLGAGLVLFQGKEGPSAVRDAVEAAAKEKGFALQAMAGLSTPALLAFGGSGIDAAVLALPAKFAGTPAEVIDKKDLRAMADVVSSVVASRRAR
jgi:endoglucanase